MGKLGWGGAPPGGEGFGSNDWLLFFVEGLGLRDHPRMPRSRPAAWARLRQTGFSWAERKAKGEHCTTNFLPFDYQAVYGGIFSPGRFQTGREWEAHSGTGPGPFAFSLRVTPFFPRWAGPGGTMFRSPPGLRPSFLPKG